MDKNEEDGDGGSKEQYFSYLIESAHAAIS